MKESPRIYNIFPRLVGSIDKWELDLLTIKEMEFNWIYVNPLNYLGFSGSLYSIKDFYRFNPLFAPSGANDVESWEYSRKFIKKCHEFDIRLMLDLVINHVAIDSELIKIHPKWFIEKWALVNKTDNNVVKFFEGIDKPILDNYTLENFNLERRIANPFAIDPTDSRKITIWGDLAEINLEKNSDLENVMNYFKDYISFCLNLGVDGFRCDAAYKISQNVWKIFINHAKNINKDVLFVAETLGCTFNECESVSKAGFDYIYSSSKWWDFTAPWCVEQYNQFRKYAPSISFPESHDTERLAFETNGRKDFQIFRYLFASIFSAGIMIPIGYEYGFKKKLDVVKTTPKDWGKINFNISSEIKEINLFKKKYICLNEDGEIVHYQYGDLNILVLRKTNLKENQQILLIYNKDWNNPHNIYLENLSYFLNFGTKIERIFIDKKPEPIFENTFEKLLSPNEYILFLQEK
ncbi:MAG TPA: alpha-amylase family glycosyl hydrolase [Candidatus Lokiarchaeia archaeon]